MADAVARLASRIYPLTLLRKMFADPRSLEVQITPTMCREALWDVRNEVQLTGMLRQERSVSLTMKRPPNDNGA